MTKKEQPLLVAPPLNKSNKLWLRTLKIFKRDLEYEKDLIRLLPTGSI